MITAALEPACVEVSEMVGFFAAAALTGLLASADRRTAVANAYVIADKMLAERKDETA
jgi:hypothetical protein